MTPLADCASGNAVVLPDADSAAAGPGCLESFHPGSCLGRSAGRGAETSWAEARLAGPPRPCYGAGTMGWNERHYAGRTMSVRPPLPRVTKALLVINIAVFVLDLLSRNDLGEGGLAEPFKFRVAEAVSAGWVWQFLSFQFLHASVGHLVFNMVGLFVFGPHVEHWWGGRRFTAYYLLCGVAGAVFFTLLFQLGLLPNATPQTGLVGASAGVFGLIFAVAMLNPAGQVALWFPPIVLTLRRLALVFAGWAVLVILGGLAFPDARIFWNAGGEAGHLGGALMGILLMKFPWLLRRGRRPGAKIIRPREFRRQAPKLRPRSVIDPGADSEVDRILDKIQAEGIDALTPEERATLAKLAEKKP